MNCINEGLIQKYIDGEATVQETSVIKEHRAVCSVCEENIIAQQKRSQSIKNAMDLLLDDSRERPNDLKPEFPNRCIESKSKKGNNKTIRRTIYTGIAASLLLFSFFFFLEEDSNPNLMMEEQIMLVQASDREVDANRSVLEQDFVINIIDPNGNVTEYSEDIN